MPMRYFDADVMNHDQFIQYHNIYRDQLKKDRIDYIEINVVGWGDEPQMCDAKLHTKKSERTGKTAEAQYEEWEKDWNHQVKMISKWRHYTEIASNYLIHYHSQCNGGDYGGRAELIFHVQTMKLDQSIYGHKYAYSEEAPTKYMGLLNS